MRLATQFITLTASEFKRKSLKTVRQKAAPALKARSGFFISFVHLAIEVIFNRKQLPVNSVQAF